MKNRLIVTLSDIHGSKQYSVHEIMKKIAPITLLILILIGVGSSIYVNVLTFKLTKIKQISTEYQARNADLNMQQKALIALIEENSEKYTSIKSKLTEVEDMIGIGPDINASFHARLEEERTKATEGLREKLHETELSSIQKILLSNVIPNGKPLSYKRISSPFGYRTHPTKKNHSFHPALDLTAKHGTPIYAPASGVVVYAKRKGAYGNFLLLAHSFGFKTAYGHLSRFAVKIGDYVAKGDVIAYVGSTGRSTGPHLHYEIRYLTKWLDPSKFMHLDLDNINNTSATISSVNWDSILKQIEKLISLSKT